MNLELVPGQGASDLYAHLDDRRFNLLVVGQVVNERVAPDLIGTHHIPDTSFNAKALSNAGVNGPRYFLLRPDGHIGLAGGHYDSAVVRRYLDAIGLGASRLAPVELASARVSIPRTRTLQA